MDSWELSSLPQDTQPFMGKCASQTSVHNLPSDESCMNDSVSAPCTEIEVVVNTALVACIEVLLSFRDDRSFNMAIKQQRSYLCHQTCTRIQSQLLRTLTWRPNGAQDLHGSCSSLESFFFGLSTMMEQRVAQAVRCMGEDNFDLRGERSSSTDGAGHRLFLRGRAGLRRTKFRYARAYSTPG